MVFDQAALDRNMRLVIPETDDNAIVLAIDNSGVKLAVHVVKADHWTVKALYAQDWDGGHELAGQVIFHWKS